MALSLSDIADQPSKVTRKLYLPNEEYLVFRPLLLEDVKSLAGFLEGLSSNTRIFSSFDSYDIVTAKALCDAINKHDKLRFVIEAKLNRIAGLLEVSFGVPHADMDRFTKYGIRLSEETDCRFGPTLADDYQSKGVGGLVFPLVAYVARGFEKKRMTLLGGVRQNNERAIRFYEKFGFTRVGEFKSKSGNAAFDMILELAE